MQRPPFNLFEGPDPPQPCENELSETIWSGRNSRIERIVSTGQASAPGFWYDQEEDEWVSVLQGHAELEFEDGQRLKMERGDCFAIPAHCRHRVAHTSSEPACIWLAVWSRSDDAAPRGDDPLDPE